MIPTEDGSMSFVPRPVPTL